MKANQRVKRFQQNDAAFLNLAPMFAAIGTIITLVLTMTVVANLFDTYVGGTRSVNENLSDPNVDFGDETTNGIAPVFAIVIGLVALVGLVGLILRPLGGGSLG